MQISMSHFFVEHYTTTASGIRGGAEEKASLGIADFSPHRKGTAILRSCR
jgi:hypothetical protein